MHRLIVGLLAIALLALPASADEAPDEYDLETAFAEADINADGHIDHREFHIRMVEIFFHGDVDKDGVMTIGELNAVIVYDLTLADIDADGDGKIQVHEFINVRVDDFDDADKDDDERLSLEEVEAKFSQ
jgi:Ca2+-binding EF-hand superfamily protein